MSAKDKDYEVLASEYRKEEKEILALTSDASSGAGKGQRESLWTATKYFLAYVDISTNELKKGDGRIVWPLSEEEEKDGAYHGHVNFDEDLRVEQRAVEIAFRIVDSVALT